MSSFYLGGDVSKGYADFIILDADRQVVEQPFRLDDTASGHHALETVLRKLCAGNPAAQVFAGVESTGGLENNWLKFFNRLSTDLPLKSTRLNPTGVKHFMKAEMVRTVSDEVSAEAIAGYLISHPQKVLYDQDDAYYTARRQWTTIILLKKQATQLYNNLHNLLYTACPSVLVYCRHGIPAWLLRILTKYPTAEQLRRVKPTTLAKTNYVPLQKAQSICNAAQKDVASATDAITTRTVQLVAEQIIALEKSIDAIVGELKKQWKDVPAIKQLCSVPGIGVYSALGLLINIRDINLYPSAKHLASYIGIHPVWRDSGDGAFGYHMSKKGRVQPRAILFLVTWVAIVHNPHIKKLYIRCQRDKKMKRIEAMVVCMHKILRIVYGMLKTNTAYDPGIDLKNQQKSKPVEKKTGEKSHEKKIRRFQEKDNAAPISRRQALKRRKDDGSQCTVSADGVITATLPPFENNLSDIFEESAINQTVKELIGLHHT
jgi:transposase